MCPATFMKRRYNLYFCSGGGGGGGGGSKSSKTVNYGTFLAYVTVSDLNVPE